MKPTDSHNYVCATGTLHEFVNTGSGRQTVPLTVSATNTAIAVMQSLGFCLSKRFKRSERRILESVQRLLCSFSQRIHARCTRLFVLDGSYLKSIAANWPDVAHFTIDLSASSHQICALAWRDRKVIRFCRDEAGEISPLSSQSLSELACPLLNGSGQVQALLHVELERPLARRDEVAFADLSKEMSPRFSKRLFSWQQLLGENIMPVSSTHFRERQTLIRQLLSSIQKAIDPNRCHAMLWEVNYESHMLTVRETTGHDQPFANGEQLPLDASLMGKVACEIGLGDYYYTTDVRTEPNFSRSDTAVAMGLRQVLAVPVFDGNDCDKQRPSWVLALYSFDRKPARCETARDWLPVDFPTAEATLGLAHFFGKLLSREKSVITEVARNAIRLAARQPNRLVAVLKEWAAVMRSHVVLYRAAPQSARVLDMDGLPSSTWFAWEMQLIRTAHQCYLKACVQLTCEERRIGEHKLDHFPSPSLGLESLNVLTLTYGTCEAAGLCVQLIRDSSTHFTTSDIYLAQVLLDETHRLRLDTDSSGSHTPSGIRNNDHIAETLHTSLLTQ